MNKIIIFPSAHEKYKTGGEKYNYYVNSYLLKKHGAQITLDIIHRDHKSKLPLSIFTFFAMLRFLIKYFLYNKTTFIEYDSQRFILFLFNIFQKIKGNKIVLFIHHLPSHNYKNIIIKKLSRIFEKLQIKLSDVIICNSKTTSLEVERFNPKAPIHIIYPAVEPINKVRNIKKNNKKSNRIDILFVGSIYERKGLHVLISALKDINIDNYFLHIVGQQNSHTKYYKNLISTIDEYKLSPKINFYGKVGDEKLSQLYNNADLFVLPSLWEGYGIVLLEALSYGVPVISSNIGAIPEIVKDGITGLLFEAGKSNQLKELLEQLLADKNKLNFLKNNCIRYIPDMKHTWEVAGEKFNSIIVEYL